MIRMMVPDREIRGTCQLSVKTEKAMILMRSIEIDLKERPKMIKLKCISKIVNKSSKILESSNKRKGVWEREDFSLNLIVRKGKEARCMVTKPTAVSPHTVNHIIKFFRLWKIIELPLPDQSSMGQKVAKNHQGKGHKFITSGRRAKVAQVKGLTLFLFR